MRTKTHGLYAGINQFGIDRPVNSATRQLYLKPADFLKLHPG